MYRIMISSQQNDSVLEILRQKSSTYYTEEFILDFLDIWSYIHKEAVNYDLADALHFSNSILESHILPFYKKHQKEKSLSLNKTWLKEYASLVINWGNRGAILFPLKLITYEICYNKKEAINSFITSLLNKEFKANQENLFDFIFPKLVNFTIPLDGVTISLLKAFQGYSKITSPLKRLNLSDPKYTEKLNISLRTLQRRMKVIQLMQLVESRFIIDLGRLGYETSLCIHQNAFPEEFKKYLLISSNLSVGTFSITQIPFKKTDLLLKLQEKMSGAVFQPMSLNTRSWNLTGLHLGEDPWQTPPSFLHADPTIQIISPTPDFQLSLEPTFNPFRNLTAADIKILEYLTVKGTFRSVKDLSENIKVAQHKTATRLEEYEKEQLLVKTHNFFNIGLDLTVFFFVSTETKEIPWIQHFLSFPKADIYSSEDAQPYYYFGHLKIPNHWIKLFARKVDRIKRDYSIKFYYKIYTPIDHARSAISLSETY